MWRNWTYGSRFPSISGYGRLVCNPFVVISGRVIGSMEIPLPTKENAGIGITQTYSHIPNMCPNYCLNVSAVDEYVFFRIWVVATGHQHLTHIIYFNNYSPYILKINLNITKSTSIRHGVFYTHLVHSLIDRSINPTHISPLPFTARFSQCLEIHFLSKEVNCTSTTVE